MAPTSPVAAPSLRCRRSGRSSASLGRTHPVETALLAAGVAADPALAWQQASADLDLVLSTAGLERPQTRSAGTVGGRAGRDGVHSEAMQALLDEPQSVARAHPLGRW
ncbi:hypothetical protein GCM10025868_17680 [Angustibacter aerolatus]|uniref:Uncharacterized protein n=1 Tax=Angustibacter aerolatus TaxID=1162965 RepID=A0ABQ6JED2_9ACTN|nr:hypothetical protein GCM10025868_17680 [Angustibacter aerolatus]